MLCESDSMACSQISATLITPYLNESINDFSCINFLY